MISISIKQGLNDIVRVLDDVQRKQIPFATAKTLTQIGQRVRDELKTELRTSFDRPTPYITNSPFSTSASKTNPSVKVGIRDLASRGASPAQYVKEHFGGGARGYKPFELAMQKLGILPNGWRAMPGDGMKTDSFGNPNRNQLAEVIGALRSKARVFAGKGKRQTLQGYFIASSNDPRTMHLEPGIYRRIQTGASSTVIPVFVFVQATAYRNRLDLERIANRVVGREFNALFERNMADALRSAR